MIKDVALFLYGYDIDEFNSNINFKASSGGSVLTAVLTNGNYTPTQFMAEVKRAMELVDPDNKYTITLNRTINAGKSNNMTIATDGAYLRIYFSSGVNADSSPRDLMGFGAVDLTGATSYTSGGQSGTILVPEFQMWNYQGPDDIVEQDGIKNVTSTGIKETLVFAQMQFFQAEWRYITNFNGRTQYTEWVAFLKYATKQLKFEFTPSINEDPTVFYQATLESTPADGNGLKYRLDLQVSQGLYRFYQTGALKFRVIVQ